MSHGLVWVWVAYHLGMRGYVAYTLGRWRRFWVARLVGMAIGIGIVVAVVGGLGFDWWEWLGVMATTAVLASAVDFVEARVRRSS